MQITQRSFGRGVLLDKRDQLNPSEFAPNSAHGRHAGSGARGPLWVELPRSGVRARRVWSRRILPVPGRGSEGLLTELTADAASWRLTVRIPSPPAGVTCDVDLWAGRLEGAAAVRSGLFPGKWIQTIDPLPRLSVHPSGFVPRSLARSTDVFRRDRELDVSAVQGRFSTSSLSQCSTDRV